MSFNPKTGLMYIPTSTANSWTYAAEPTLRPAAGPDDGHRAADAGRDAAAAARDRSRALEGPADAARWWPGIP